MLCVVFFSLLLASPLWAISVSGGATGGVSADVPDVNPDIPVPNVDGVCDCPVIPNLDALVCILDWISHCRILTKEVRTVNGTTFSQYTLKHIDIIKGALSLPTVLIIPEGPCGLELEVNVEYLLSGLVTGESNLYSVLCLQVLHVLSPVWTLCKNSLLNKLDILAALGEIICILLNGIIGPILSVIQIPEVLDCLPTGGLL